MPLCFQKASAFWQQEFCLPLYTLDRTPRFIFLGIGIVLIIIAVILLIRYIKQVTAFKKYKPAWEKHKSIYDDFAIELNHWYDSGLPPKSCDGDTSYALRLQRERLGRKGIRMIHYTAPAKETPGTTYFQETPHGIPLILWTKGSTGICDLKMLPAPYMTGNQMTSCMRWLCIHQMKQSFII